MKRNMAPIIHFFILVLLSSRSRGLKLLDMRVPQQAELNEATTLSCNFDLAGLKLYSVKWYKDDFEFFRYMPDNSPHSQALPVPGITVDLSASDMNTITLTHLGFNSSGSYRCEVSTESPNFMTVVASSNMTVRALPQDDPTIEGIASTYSIGDYVMGNCTSAKSNPPSILAWYINDVKVDRWYLEPATDETDSQGLHTRTLGLRLQAEKRHFQTPTRTMELRCSATVLDETWHRVISPGLTQLTNQKLAQERLANTATTNFVLSAGGLLMITSLLKVYSS